MRSKPPSRVALVCAALLTAALPIAGCRREPPPDYLRLRGPAPALAGLPSSRAHLLVFWASWCPPCREETPALRALAREPPEGLQVVTFSHDADLPAVQRFFGGPAPPELQLRLDEGRTAAQALGVEALPVSFLVVEGRLLARFDGPRAWDSRAMRRLLERLITRAGEQAGAASH